MQINLFSFNFASFWRLRLAVAEWRHRLRCGIETGLQRLSTTRCEDQQGERPAQGSGAEWVLDQASVGFQRAADRVDVSLRTTTATKLPEKRAEDERDDEHVGEISMSTISFANPVFCRPAQAEEEEEGREEWPGIKE